MTFLLRLSFRAKRGSLRHRAAYAMNLLFPLSLLEAGLQTAPSLSSQASHAWEP